MQEPDQDGREREAGPHGHHLAFQPIMQSPFRDGGPLLYWEALSRGIDRNGNRYTPMEWLNDPDHAVALDQRVLEMAIRALSRNCPVSHNGAARIGVNANALSLLDATYLNRLFYHLEYGIRPERIVIELTESFIMERDTIEPLLAALRRIRAAGVAVALDDFGTGGAGVGMFSMFEFDYVKVSPWIDIKTLRGTSLLEALLKASHHHPRFQVIYEGVENRQHYETIRDLGIDGAQGFYVGRPEAVFNRPRGLPDPEAPEAPGAHEQTGRRPVG